MKRGSWPVGWALPTKRHRSKVGNAHPTGHGPLPIEVFLMNCKRALLVALFLTAAALPAGSAQQPPDLNDLYEKAIKEAVKKVSPCVVQIVTLGGTDIVSTGPKGATIRKGLGPTTGVIVSSDGYVI